MNNVLKEVAFEAAKQAVFHCLNAIADDPRKFWLMGDLTGSYEKLTKAAVLLSGKSIDEIKLTFRPRKEVYERYVNQRDADEVVLQECRAKGALVRANSRRFTNRDITRWAERHGLKFPTISDARCAFEDAQTLYTDEEVFV